MYFVSGEPYWIQSVESQMVSERSDKFISDMLDSWSIKVNYKKIALADLNIG